MDDEPDTFERTRQRVLDLCDDGDLERPDLIVDTLDGELAAFWFARKVVMIVGEDEAGGANPIEDADVIEAIAAMTLMCADNDFPKPDGIRFDPSTRMLQFVWKGEFDAAWQLDELLVGIREGPLGERQRQVMGPAAGSRSGFS